jgi:hypothetical protein
MTWDYPREKEDNMSIKFNDSEKIYGGFSNATPARRNNNYNNTNDAAIGAAMIIGGLLGAAAVAAAADEDYTSRRAAEIRREAEREAARREAQRRADEIRREAERAARHAAYGLTNDEVVHEIVKFCMKETMCTNKMVVMTAIVREMFAQGATINSAESEFGDLKIKGRCVDGNDLKIILNSIGGITVDAYDGRLNRYSSSSKVFKEYEILVKDCNKPNFDKLARVMSY